MPGPAHDTIRSAAATTAPALTAEGIFPRGAKGIRRRQIVASLARARRESRPMAERRAQRGRDGRKPCRHSPHWAAAPTIAR
jgi:hypothetical protein